MVRFAAPFAIWCDHCALKNPGAPVVIGKGTRFNAEKKSAGAYLSIPILSFRIKHTICGQWIEIRTDPQHADYIVFSGGKRRDYGDEAENLVAKNAELEQNRRHEDAFAALEGRVTDKKEMLDGEKRIQTLRKRSHQDWSDTYAGNRRLRRTFRIERKIIEKEAEAAAALKDRMSLAIELLPESRSDIIQAQATEFYPRGAEDEDEVGDASQRSRRKSRKLRRLLIENTKQNVNPFNAAKALENDRVQDDQPVPGETNGQAFQGARPLVEYDSG